MKSILPLLKNLLLWFFEKWYFWLSLLIIIVALCITLRPHSSEPVIRITGLVLQWVGIGTVIWGISETRTLFGLPKFTNIIKSYFNKFPHFHQKIILGSATMQLSAPSLKARAVLPDVPIDQTTEARLDSLEKNLSLINEHITQTQIEMDENVQKNIGALKIEEGSRISGIQRISKKLELTETGGIHISLIGAIFLLLRITLSTASTEISCLLK